MDRTEPKAIPTLGPLATISMALSPTGPSPLRVLDACREGWIAFGRAPWPFLLFSLLSALAMGACVLPIALGGSILVTTALFTDPAPEIALPRLIVLLISMGAVLGGVLLLGVAALLSTLGFYRGAWLALEGQKPRLADLIQLIRWDGVAINRLVLAWTAEQLLLLIPLGLVGLLGLDLQRQGLPQPLIWWPLGLVALAWTMWLGVTQTFLNPLCLFGTTKPIATVSSGIRVVQRQWWRVFGLQTLLGALIVVSSFASANALSIALVPVVICIKLAAYRQLFGADDRLEPTRPRG